MVLSAFKCLEAMSPWPCRPPRLASCPTSTSARVAWRTRGVWPTDSRLDLKLADLSSLITLFFFGVINGYNL